MTTPLVVTVDADTLLHPEALTYLIARVTSRPQDQHVCACAGALIAENANANFLTRMQGWDYRLGINGVKRTQAAYNSALVAQGAFSAYWTDDIRAVGGWPDAIGEDIVLTWSLMDARGLVQYEPLALAATIVPVQVKHFMRQRSRWARGMIEGIGINPPQRQPRVLAKFVAGIDYLVPLLDIGYVFFWIPGVILFIFGYPLLFSWWSMLVIPITLVVYGLLRSWQDRHVFQILHAQPEPDRRGFFGYLLGYQALTSSPRCAATRSSCGGPRGAGSRRTSERRAAELAGSARPADADRMGSPVRALVVLALALAIAAGQRHPFMTTSSAAATERGHALFGLDVPSLAALDQAESAIGARAAIVGTFADWAHAPRFPRAHADAINRRGAVPLISWEPWDSWRGGADQPEYALRRIAAGDHDALIDRWAAAVARYRRPVMLRFAPEMNGDWLPWSEGVNGNRRGRLRRRLAARARALPPRRRRQRDLGLEPDRPLRGLGAAARALPGRARRRLGGGRRLQLGRQPRLGLAELRRRAWLRPCARCASSRPGGPVMIAETGCAPGARKASWVTETFAAPRALTASARWCGSSSTRRPTGGSPATRRPRRPRAPRWTGGAWRRGRRPGGRRARRRALALLRVRR